MNRRSFVRPPDEKWFLLVIVLLCACWVTGILWV